MSPIVSSFLYQNPENPNEIIRDTPWGDIPASSSLATGMADGWRRKKGEAPRSSLVRFAAPWRMTVSRALWRSTEMR
jgi:hypothetical protein